MRSSTDRVLLLALAASLLLHLLLLRSLPETVPPAPLPPAPPVELTWVEVAASTPAAPEPPPAVPPATRRAVVRAAPAAEEPTTGALPSAATGEVRGDATRSADQPRLITLVPSSDVLPPVAVEERAHGRTLYPEDLPSQAELDAEASARVADRVEQFARDRLAEARVEGGLVDPYFTDLRRRIRSGMAQVPDFSTDPNPVRKLSRSWYSSWKAAAERYGATGSAYGGPPSRTDVSEVPSVLAREADRGSAQARELAQTLQMGARLRDFGEGRLGAELYAVVELRQSGTGLVEQISLLQPSGVAPFDAWVLERAGTAAEELGPPDAGAFPGGLRSTWAFTGRVSYRRTMKDVKLLDDGWYLALAALPGLLTGTFDEVSGTVEYVDLRHPHYEASVKLLRVYDGAR